MSRLKRVTDFRPKVGDDILVALIDGDQLNPHIIQGECPTRKSEFVMIMDGKFYVKDTEASTLKGYSFAAEIRKTVTIEVCFEPTMVTMEAEEYDKLMGLKSYQPSSTTDVVPNSGVDDYIHQLIQGNGQQSKPRIRSWETK